MTPSDTHARIFEKYDQAYQQSDYTAAQATLDLIHRQYHDHAWIHTQVHWLGFRLNIKYRHYRRALFEIFVLPFAPPASWAQKYLGLVRKLD
jgi:hypothetical protein